MSSPPGLCLSPFHATQSFNKFLHSSDQEASSSVPRVHVDSSSRFVWRDLTVRQPSPRLRLGFVIYSLSANAAPKLHFLVKWRPPSVKSPFSPSELPVVFSTALLSERMP